jgi:hypothetical protein
MPAPPLTSRTRRLLLQVVLVALFGGTLAAAAWVRHAKLTPAAIELSQAVDLRYVTAKLPGGWALDAGQRGNSRVYSAAALEPRDPYGARPGRYVEVTVERMPASIWAILGGITPDRYLQDNFHVAAGGGKPTTVAGQRGILVQLSEPQISEATGVPTVHVYACAILPQQFAVTVHLQVSGRRPNPWDLRLLAQVADAIQVPAGPAAGGPAVPPPAADPAGDEIGR